MSKFTAIANLTVVKKIIQPGIARQASIAIAIGVAILTAGFIINAYQIVAIGGAAILIGLFLPVLASVHQEDHRYDRIIRN